MVYLDIAFIIILVLYLFFIFGMINALRLDAPYVPIKPEVLNRMLELVSPEKDSLWIDLGSGDGRILIEAIKRFGVRGRGIERVMVFRLYSRLKIYFAGFSKKITIQSGDFFKKDLSDAGVVSLYLLPRTNAKLHDKLKKELKPGARILIHRFPISGVPLEKEDPEYKIFVYKID